MENGKAQVTKQTGLDIFDFVNISAALNKATAQIATLMQEKVALEERLAVVNGLGAIPPAQRETPSA